MVCQLQCMLFALKMKPDFLLKEIFVSSWELRDLNCGFVLGQPNFGAIEIDWNATPLTLKIEVRDIDGLPVAGIKMPLLELKAGSVPAATVEAGKYRRHCSLESTLPWLVRYRLAILLFSAVASMSTFDTSIIFDKCKWQDKLLSAYSSLLHEGLQCFLLRI